MANRIDLDHSRFRNIVRGAIRRDLRKHIANGALTARHGAKTVKIPVPQIELPKFRFGSNDSGGRVGSAGVARISRTLPAVDTPHTSAMPHQQPQIP